MNYPLHAIVCYRLVLSAFVVLMGFSLCFSQTTVLSENFDTQALPTGWARAMNTNCSSTGHPSWKSTIEGGSSGNTWCGGSGCAVGKGGVGECMFFYDWFYTGVAGNYLETPANDLSSYSTATLTFYYYNYADGDLIRVYAKQGAGSYSLVGGPYAAGGSSWVLVQIDLSAYAGTGFNAVKIKFEGDGVCGGSNIGFDDFLLTGSGTPCGIEAGTASASPTDVSHCTSTTTSLEDNEGTIDWEYSYDESSWTSTGVSTSDYTRDITQTTYVRAAVTDGCTSYSNTVTFTIDEAEAEASPDFVAIGESSTLTVTGYGSSTIQWQSSSDDATWSDIGGATSSTYIATLGASTYFRAKLTNTCGTHYSTSDYVKASNVYYVNDGSTSGDTWCTAIGNDGNNGQTVSTPKATIQDVFDDYDLDPCDRIYVDNGNYSFNTTISSSSDAGDATGNVIIYGAGTSKTIISNSSAAHNFEIDDVSYIEIRDMSITKSNASYTNIYIKADSDNIKVDDCVLSCTGTNIIITGDSDSYTILNSTITSTGGSSYCAVHIMGDPVDWVAPTSGTISNNEISAVYYGVKIDEENLNQPNGHTVTQNTITMTSQAVVDGACVWFDHADNNTVTRNKMSGARNGIYVDSDSDDAIVNNNFIWDVQRGIYCVDFASNEWIVRHNSFYVTGGCVRFESGGGSVGEFWGFENNIFYTTANATGEYVLYSESQYPYAEMMGAFDIDYNIYYTPNGARIAYYGYGSSSYSTLAAWQAFDHNGFAGGNGDANSVSTDPNYLNTATGGLELTGNYQTGDNLIASVPIDIYGTARTNPTIGAWEFGSPLPVELIEFIGECGVDKNTVYWNTATEKNSSHFILEHSMDGHAYEIVDQIPAAGNSNSISSYQVEDHSAASLTYYRLTQIDLNGAGLVKGTIAVRCDEKRIATVIYPNPATGNSTAIVTVDEANELYIVIHNALGQIVFDKTVQLNTGQNFILLDTDVLSKGIYMVDFVIDNYRMDSEKIIKQ